MDIDKHVILINGSNTSNLRIDIEPIKNVLSIKHIEMNAVLSSSTPANDIKKIYILLNDYKLKTLYDTNNYNLGIPVFGNLIFKPDASHTTYQADSVNSGIISDFRADNQNYVFNPMLGELHRLNISFKEYDNGELVGIELKEFSMELCIYSSRAKLTML